VTKATLPATRPAMMFAVLSGNRAGRRSAW
jgi:hypothetical protein